LTSHKSTTDIDADADADADANADDDAYVDAAAVPARNVIFAAAALPDSVGAAAWQIIHAAADASEGDLLKILQCVESVFGVLRRMAAPGVP
jgi:hypothetical protein